MQSFRNVRVGIVVAMVVACACVSAQTVLGDADSMVRVVVDGKPTSVIVVPGRTRLSRDQKQTPAKKSADEPKIPPSVSAAAYELQRYIKKASGVRLKIVREDKATKDRKGVTTRLYLGPCHATEDVIGDMGRIEPGGYVIRAGGSDLYVAGNGEGVRYAVYDLLEDELRIRWVMPRDIGEVVPQTDTITFSKQVDTRYQPVVKFRRLRDVPRNRKARRGMKQLYRDLGYDLDSKTYKEGLKQWSAFYDPNRLDHWSSNAPQWFQRQKEGWAHWVPTGHAFNDYWQRYGKTHPEIFALQPDGSRKQHPSRPRLCVSSPELWDIVADNVIKTFRKHPKKKIVSIAPNDGGYNKFCMGKRCRSWDPADAPKIHSRLLVNPKTGKPYDQYPSLSDRYFKFYNKVAERVAKVFPDRQLSVMAYSAYRTAPVSIDKIQPNIKIVVVSWNKDTIQAWGKVSDNFLLRPNNLVPVHGGLAQNNTHTLAKRIKFAVKMGATGFDFDKCAWNWGTQGLDYYVAMRLFWNPSVQVDNVIRDYCRAAFGAGADPMRRYFRLLRAITESLKSDRRKLTTREWLDSSEELFVKNYDRASLQQLRGYVQAAKKRVSNKRSGDYKRIDVYSKGLEYTQRAIGLLRFASNVNTKDEWNRYKTKRREFRTFLTKQIGTYAINVGYCYKTFRRRLLNPMGRKVRGRLKH